VSGTIGKGSGSGVIILRTSTEEKKKTLDPSRMGGELRERQRAFFLEGGKRIQAEIIGARIDRTES